MAIAYANAGVLTGAASGTSITPSLPASIAAGDLLIAAVHTVSATAGVTHTWPAGWTNVDSLEMGGNVSDYGVASFAYRVATGSDTAPAVTLSTSTQNAGQIFRYTGVSLTPINANRSSHPGSGSHVIPSISTTADSSTVLYLDLAWEGSTLLATPTGWTGDSSLYSSAGGVVISIGHKAVPVSGTVSGDINTSGAPTYESWQQEILIAHLPMGGFSIASVTSTAQATQNAHSVAVSNGILITSPAGVISQKCVALSSMLISSYALVGTNSRIGAASSLAVSGNTAPGIKVSAFADSLISAHTTASAPTILWELVSSSLTMVGAAANARYTDAWVRGTLIMNGQVLSSAVYSVFAQSQLQVMEGIKFVQQYWDGWSFNLNTKAPSFYENFKFNSFARIGDEYYGCNDTGIYLLGGDLDDTTNINSVITTNLSDLSTETYDGSRMKIVPNVYVEARSSEPMLLTCKVEGKPCTYKFRAGKTEIASSRADIGKGLEGTFWQFELKNQNGSDFEILSLTAMPVTKSRRF